MALHHRSLWDEKCGARQTSNSREFGWRIGIMLSPISGAFYSEWVSKQGIVMALSAKTALLTS